MERTRSPGIADVVVRRVKVDADRPAAQHDDRDRVAVEAPLELRMAGGSGGRVSTVLMRTPGQDDELVRGFLYTEGMIRDLDDVIELARPANLVGDEVGNVIAVRLRPGIDVPLERTFYGSSSCGVCGKTTISSLVLRAPKVAGAIRVSGAVLSQLPARLREAQPAFAATGGLHASALFDEDGAILAAREDVGRHNAVDKLVGWALAARRLPAPDVLLLVSGRIGYEIVQKAIAAGVPLVAGVGAPSSLAIRIAEEFGVTLAGFVRGGSMNVYCGAERVI